MYRPADFHCFPIKFYQQLLIPGFALIAFSAIILPSRASASCWFFCTNANATVNTFYPDSGTPALVAAANSDPNPNKDPGAAIQTSGGKALLAYSGISGRPASLPPPDRISVYEVRPGDTLSEIAVMFGVSVNTIIWANNLSGGNDVHPKDILIILPVSGVEYTVVKGDTLKSVATKYNADVTEIAQYNGLDPAAPLVIGSTIIIPGGEISAPAPAASTKILTRTTSTSNTSSDCGGPAQNGYYGNPVPGGIITQGVHGCNAVDIGAARGTPIHAAAKGTVIIARTGGWNGGYGNYAVITHDNGSQTLYAHMKNVIISPGQSVSSGQVIGYVGMTGITTGPHLHFEVRGAVNPFRNCRVGSVCSPQ